MKFVIIKQKEVQQFYDFSNFVFKLNIQSLIK